MQIATPYDDQFEEAPRERILVVEDNGGLGRTLTLAIRCLGCDATVVATVRGAIDLLADLEDWAGIILDLSLGDGPGLSVLEWVRERDRDISVLIHTAHTEHAAISAAFNLQAYFLEKPSTPAQIERFLRVAEASARQRRTRRSGTPGGEDLPEDLRELVGGVLSTAVELGTKESEYAYRLALLARAANGRRLDGRSATGACADAVSVSRQTLRLYASVAARWEPEDLPALLRRRDCKGRPLTTSHLVAIARAPRSSRDELTERALRDGLDVRQLHALVADGEGEMLDADAEGTSALVLRDGIR
jgi:DNA-binding response OmpR family regulator